MKLKHPVRMLGALGAALLAIAMFASLAQAETPAPGYGQFAGCPSPKSEKPGIATCVTSTITGGQLHLGNKETPITSPMTLSGGIGPESGPLYFNSKGGLSKAKQKVNGGLIGLTGLTWLAELLGSEALTLYATAELAGTVVINNPEDVSLPLKVHLENSTGVLGSNCYIGSTTSPINLRLVTGASGALTGKQPEYVFNPTLETLKGSNGQFVDGTFKAPEAHGCVLHLFGFIPVNIDGVINLASGLPASTGNFTKQNYNIEIVESELVYP
jgi:hypothetical protein